MLQRHFVDCSWQTINVARNTLFISKEKYAVFCYTVYMKDFVPEKKLDFIGFFFADGFMDEFSVNWDGFGN